MKNMQYLIAVDLEGVHGVVGEAYKGLSKTCQDYKLATENAIKEINAAVEGLFEAGAETVAVWDNHAGGGNLDFSQIDPRVIRVTNTQTASYERLGFAKDFSFSGILYIGYHSKAGTVNGVLAHTYSSATIQYYKVNGRAVGELDVDSWAAAERGIAPLFCASDDAGVKQALEIEAQMCTVTTKYGTGRNSAEFRPEEDVLKEIKENAGLCVTKSIKPKKLQFPAIFEVRYTRLEDAVKRLETVLSKNLEAKFGEDGHTIVATLHQFTDLEKFL